MIMVHYLKIILKKQNLMNKITASLICMDLSDIKTALLEENGKISFLPYSNKRPLNPNDMNIRVNDEALVTNLIIDGKIMEDGLKKINLDKEWLYNSLKKQGIVKIDNIFLAIYDIDGNLSVYLSNTVK